jgi:CheY-like chemotaxis protein
VTSEIGLGTTFTLYFPSQAVPSVPTPSPEPPTLPAGHGEIILLVEDETTVLQVMQQILTHLGYQVLTATNGHEALARYDQAQEPIQLVLTDLTMPQMGGLELAHALSQRDRTLPIVILTGYPLNLEKQTDVCPSVIEWAKKPLRRAQLAQLVSRSLRP